MGSSSDMDHSDDLDDELLVLAGEDDESSRRRKRARSSSTANTSKRRKHEIDDNDDDDEDDERMINPYPIEGKYRDEDDRQALLDLPEIEREAILSERLEERQKFADRANLEKLYRANRAGNGDDDEPVSKAAKRSHTRVGKTSEKAKGLAALAESRKAKRERDANSKATSSSPSKHRRNPSSDYSTDEDGEIGGYDDYYGSDRRPRVSEKVTLEELSKARITRDMLVRNCHLPWFEELVEGGWVRYRSGADASNRPVYKICQILEVSPNTVPAYTVENIKTNKQLLLKHANLVKAWNMDNVSNAPFEKEEFESLARHLEAEKVRWPRVSNLEKKHDTIVKIARKELSPKEFEAMLKARNEALNSGPNFQSLLTRKATLNSRRALAHKRHDQAEVLSVTRELMELEAAHPELARASASSKPTPAGEASANKVDGVKSQGSMDWETQRRKALAAAHRITGSNASSRAGTPPVKDLSARVKTMPRLRMEMDESKKKSEVVSAAAIPNTAEMSPTEASAIDAIASTIQIDLGDF